MKRAVWIRWTAAGAVGLGALLPPASARACAVCFGGGDILAGFTVSWIFLVLMPFAVLGSVGGWVYWMHRRARRRPSEGRTGHPATANAALAHKESGI